MLQNVVYRGVGAFRMARDVLNIPRTMAIKITINLRFLSTRQYSLKLISYCAKIHLYLENPFLLRGYRVLYFKYT
jgi:hypothetical protein